MKTLTTVLPRIFCTCMLLVAILISNTMIAGTFTVNSLSDIGTGAGNSGDFRYCIGLVNGAAGPHIINFSVAGTISLTSDLPGINQQVNIDGSTAPGYIINTPKIEVNGNNTVNNGLLFNAVAAASSTVIGLCVNSAKFNNILLVGVNMITIQDSFIGTDLAGTASALATQGTGILSNASSNLMLSNCVVSGNSQVGINITNNSNDCVIYGCRVGINNSGTAAIINGSEGISIQTSSLRVIIGGALASQRNIIAGNSLNGIMLTGSSNNATITNNYIGTNKLGNVAISNASNGININGSNSTIIQNNIISGNTFNGIEIQNSSLTNTISGNTIGVNATGIVALANNSNGIYIHQGSNGNSITNNVISGNNGHGLYIDNTNNFTITANKIGTTSANGALGNGVFGIFFQNNCDAIRIGGNTTSLGNIISANLQNGLQCDNNCTNIKIQGNYVGTDNNGSGNSAVFGNGQVGIMLTNATINATIGGSNAGEGNVISGNGRLFDNVTVFNGSGIYIAGSCTGTIIKGNYVGLKTDGVTSMGNGKNGIEILSASGNFQIGGSTITERNLISSNGTKVAGVGQGLVVYQSNAGIIIGNYFGTDKTGTLVRGNEQSGMVIIDCQNLQIGQASASKGNLINNNIELGIHIVSGLGHIIYNNVIGVSTSGTSAGNLTGGIFILGVNVSSPGGTGMIVGGTGALQPNTIAYSTGTGNASYGNGYGVGVADNNLGNQNRIIGNKIYCNAGLGIDLDLSGAFGSTSNSGNNGKPSPSISSSSSNTISGAGTNGDRIDVYIDSSCGCQAKYYLGFTTVSGGVWSLSHNLGLLSSFLQRISVTATDASNNTSQLSCYVPLPVEMVYFEAKPSNNSIILSWITVTEINNDKFLIQKSTDGIHFETIGEEKGKGNYNGYSDYSFIDGKPADGINYYRLVQVDFNQKTTTSSIKTASINLASVLLVYPNPFENTITIGIGKILGNVTFRLYDVIGQELLNTIQYIKSEDGYLLDLHDFTSGIYILGIETEDKSTVQKISKK